MTAPQPERTPDMNDPIDPAIVEAQAPVLQAMAEYASAIRGDWSGFDGRDEKRVILDWIADLKDPKPDRDIDWYRRDLELCMAGGGHWCGVWGHCDSECGCLTCADDDLQPNPQTGEPQ